MNKYISNLGAFLLKEEQNLYAYALLILICFSTLHGALSFVPANGDDLILLSSVAKISTPIKYFIGDWGLGNNGYRPLHSLTIWLGYQVFGVFAGFNQLINLVLHSTIICLLFRLIRRVQPDIIIAFLLTSLSLVSLYTISPAKWVSDRPSLFVALFFLLLLNHLYKNGQPNVANIPYIAILSVLSLMSKESGLIVPLFVLYYAFCLKQPRKYRIKIVILAIVIILIYIIFRLVIFGSNAISYSETGYIFGVISYDSLFALPKHLQYYAYFENVLKNLIAPFLPIFDGRGGLLVHFLIKISPFWILTMLLVVLTTRKELSVFQKVALFIILLNSVIHYSVFRYRTQYLSQIAISIFIASSPLLKSNNNRKAIVKVITTVLLIYSVVWAGRNIDRNLLNNYEVLNKYDLRPIVEKNSSRIDSQIVIRVLQRYKK